MPRPQAPDHAQQTATDKNKPASNAHNDIAGVVAETYPNTQAIKHTARKAAMKVEAQVIALTMRTNRATPC